MPREQSRAISVALFRLGCWAVPWCTRLNRSVREPPGKNSVTIM